MPTTIAYLANNRIELTALRVVLERPSVGVGFGITLGDCRVADARIAVGSVGHSQRRMRDAEVLRQGKGFVESMALLSEAGRLPVRPPAR